MIAVLHTWGQNLHHHPHVHCVVPGGGLSLEPAPAKAGTSDGSPAGRDFSCPYGFCRACSGGYSWSTCRTPSTGQLRFFSDLASLADPATPPPTRHSIRPLRLLWRRGKCSAIAMVRPSGREDMAEMAISARSSKRVPMDPPQRNPETPSAAASQASSFVCHRERNSTMRPRIMDERWRC